MKIFFMGYHAMDFPDSKDPSRRIQGFSLFLAQEGKDIVGVRPVSNDGKRFLTAVKAKQLGITSDWLDNHVYDFIDIDIDFNGKIVDISDYSEAKSAAV